jgi:hypothetical protein
MAMLVVVDVALDLAMDQAFYVAMRAAPAAPPPCRQDEPRPHGSTRAWAAPRC